MTGVEVLSHDEYWDLWGDPDYCAKRRREAEQSKDFCGSCHEAPCICGEAARLLAEIQAAPVVEFDLRTGAYQIHHYGEDVA